MKHITLLLILFFTAHQALAECAMMGITYYPQQRTISQNSMFIIEGYAYSQKIIHSFENDRQAYLENTNGERIELILQEIVKGQMGLTQALFKPAQKLTLNEKYYLKFSHLTPKENYTDLTRYNADIKDHEPVAWEVTQEQAKEVNNSLKLHFKKTDVQYYGCGPAAYAIFQPENMPEEEIWFKTEVYDESRATSTTFMIKIFEGRLRVGHGMCSGGFTFNKDGNYKVRFTPMNTDGKEIATTAWQSFESPYKYSKDPMGF